MRFGISATSWIFPKNFLTRLRPVTVCAIVLSLYVVRSGAPGTTLQKAAIHRDHLDRRSGAYLSGDSGGRTAGSTRPNTGLGRGPFSCDRKNPRSCLAHHHQKAGLPAVLAAAERQTR